MEVYIDDTLYIPAPDHEELEGAEAALAVMTEHGTVRDTLYKLLAAVWVERERFSGKYPFGDSGWHWDILNPLAKAGYVDLGPRKGEDWFSPTPAQLEAAEKYVGQLISSLCYGE